MGMQFNGSWNTTRTTASQCIDETTDNSCSSRRWKLIQSISETNVNAGQLSGVLNWYNTVQQLFISGQFNCASPTSSKTSYFDRQYIKRTVHSRFCFFLHISILISCKKMNNAKLNGWTRFLKIYTWFLLCKDFTFRTTLCQYKSGTVYKQLLLKQQLNRQLLTEYKY